MTPRVRLLLMAGAWMPLAMQAHILLAAPTQEAARLAFLTGMLTVVLILQAAGGSLLLLELAIIAGLLGAIGALTDATWTYRAGAGLAQAVMAAMWVALTLGFEPRSTERLIAAWASAFALLGLALFVTVNAVGPVSTWMPEMASITTRVLGTPWLEPAMAILLWAGLYRAAVSRGIV